MKIASWKEQDRALSERARAYSIAHDPMIDGTFDKGRNKAKAARRATRFGSVWVNPKAAAQRPTKAVQPAYRVRLPIVRRAKVLTHAPRSRKGSTTPLWMKRLRNRRRDAIARASR